MEKINIYFYNNQNQESKWFNEFKNLLTTFIQRFSTYTPDFIPIVDIKKNDKNAICILFLTQTDESQEIINNYLEKISENNLFVIKILTTKISNNELSQPLQQYINYNFFAVDYEDNLVLNIEQLLQQNITLFTNKLVDVGYDIINYYYNKKTDNKKEKLVTSNNIYISYTGIDQIETRENIKRELIQKGYRIFPENNYSGSVSSIKKQISEEIEKCSLSIHILCNDNNVLSKNDNTNMVELQNQQAIEYYQKINSFNIGKNNSIFSRLIWLQPDIKITTDSQRIWLNNFIHSSETMIGAELIQSPLESFKSIIEEKLSTNIQYQENIINQSQSDNKKVYLLFDYKDEDKITPIHNWLEQNNYQALKTPYSINYLDLIKLHRTNLLQCDIIIVYQNTNNNQWFESKLRDIKKSPGFGRTKKFLSKIVLHTQNIDNTKKQFQEFDFYKFENLYSINNIKQILTKFK